MIKSIKGHQDSVIVTDCEGNELWYLKIGKGVQLSQASFNGNDYEFNTQWKKCKRGKISYEFVRWVETLDPIFSKWYHDNLNELLPKFDINYKEETEMTKTEMVDRIEEIDNCVGKLSAQLDRAIKDDASEIFIEGCQEEIDELSIEKRELENKLDYL